MEKRRIIEIATSSGVQAQFTRNEQRYSGTLSATDGAGTLTFNGWIDNTPTGNISIKETEIAQLTLRS